MITKVSAVKNAKKYPCSWWNDIKIAKRTFNFKPGLNFVVGPNGSGKSTLLTSMAKMFCCVQGGKPVITQSAMMEANEFLTDVSILDGMNIEHDGSVAYYMNPELTVGLIGGGFDDDFFKDGMAATMNRRSSGEKAIHDLDRILSIILDAKETGNFIDNRLKHANDTYQRRVSKFLKFIGGTGKNPTLILDEPDKSLDSINQIELWTLLQDASSQVQIIVATHSVIAMHMEGNFVETKRGYRKECLKNWDSLMGKNPEN